MVEYHRWGSGEVLIGRWWLLIYFKWDIYIPVICSVQWNVKRHSSLTGDQRQRSTWKMNAIIALKILPFQGLMHLRLGTEELSSKEQEEDFLVFLGKQMITRCSLFKLNVSVGIRQPAPGGGQTWLLVMAPKSIDKFGIFTHERGCDSSGSYSWLCPWPKLQWSAHWHPLLSAEPTHISFLHHLPWSPFIYHPHPLTSWLSLLLTPSYLYCFHIFWTQLVLVSLLVCALVRVSLWVHTHVHVFTYICMWTKEISA